MIHVQFKDPRLQELVSKALVRSVSAAQLSLKEAGRGLASIYVGDMLPADGAQFAKIVVFGPRPRLGSKAVTLATALPAASGDGIKIVFESHALTRSLHLRERHFERYDFAREWNNLGYGRIENDPSAPWGVGSVVGDTAAAFAVVWDEPKRSVLWYNRNVGPIDGFDWRMLEDFISDYRAGDLVTLPVLSEVPSGFSGALTFRIDCDEAIESGRPLFELYRRFGFPFSVAIKTDQPITDGAVKLMKEILSAGGSVVSHSHTHACDWGESPSRPGPRSSGAKWEATTSRSILELGLGIKVRYAVSPFHQNPPRAVLGIQDGGLEAFVGGIICNDPEYLMARSGLVPFVEGAVSHSEQCMFHGDCYHQAGNSARVYVDAFETALKTETFFGYLDHPFSAYQYGWTSEEERLGVHEEFLRLVASRRGLWFASLTDMLDFLWDRAHTDVTVAADGAGVQFARASTRSAKKLAVRWNGERVELG
ncbi:MAG: hypothetical protein JST80_08720 [Bdellovibrionales bacterium]|nr:hypothetical protein [Bdellovibrionales bacterium]